ncbi:MAG: hypothetical protein ACJ8AC_01950 [Gemmatimonadaceae bacterium]
MLPRHNDEHAFTDKSLRLIETQQFLQGRANAERVGGTEASRSDVEAPDSIVDDLCFDRFGT